MGQCDSGLAARTPLLAREGSSMTDVLRISVKSISMNFQFFIFMDLDCSVSGQGRSRGGEEPVT